MSGPEPDWAEYDAQEVAWAYSVRDEAARPVRYTGGADPAFAAEWLGMDVTDELLHQLAGVPAGARVTVCGVKGHLAISALGQARIVNRAAAEVVVRYASLVHVPLPARSGGKAPQVLKFHYCTSEPGRTGFATDAVARMVAGCERVGFIAIEAILAGDRHDLTDTSTGYYAWPAQGFDAALADWSEVTTRPLPPALQALPDGTPVRLVLDVFGLPGGQEWWLQNGSTVLGAFDVRRGSRSREQLERAVTKLSQERGKK